MDKFKVTCLKCGQSDILHIDNNRHFVVETDRKINTPFLAFRWRGDGSWGFHCVCGNDSRLAASEKADFNDLVAGSPNAIKKIADMLLIPDTSKFRLEAV